MNQAAVAVEVAFARETVAQVWDEIQPLLADHFRETCPFPDLPLAPSRQSYDLMEQAGCLRIFTVRSVGQLVGYCVVMVSVNPHHSTTGPMAMGDVLYLVPRLRGEGFGRQLVDFGDDALAGEGCSIVFRSGKLKGQYLNTLRHCGYAEVDSLWARRLDGGRIEFPGVAP